MEVSGSITYIINPEASTSVCGSSSNGDANACFEVYGTTQGNIAVEAFWQSRCTWFFYCTVSIHIAVYNNNYFSSSLYLYACISCHMCRPGGKSIKLVHYHILGT